MNSKKFIALAALLLPVSAAVFASGANDPLISVITINENTRQVNLNWSRIKNPENFRYGLYRANRADQSFELVREITFNDYQVVDETLTPPLTNYFYFAHHVALGQPLEATIALSEGRRITDAEIEAQHRTIPPEMRWQNEHPPGYAANYPTTNNRRSMLPDGIYMGLALFSNKVDAPTALIPLDPSGRRELFERLNVNFARSNATGTALYYAEHLVLENITTLERLGSLPHNIDSVNIITFTDGLDTASTDIALPPAGSVNFAGKQTASYMSYISQQIRSKRVGGKKIDAWAIGIPGRDVMNESEFSRTLESISSSPENIAYLSNFSQIEERLNSIANEINLWTPVVQLTWTTPAYPVGTVVRLTFDERFVSPEGVPRYIEGRISYDASKPNASYTLSGLSAYGIKLAASTPVDGRRTADGIEYSITLNDNFDERTLQQWYRQNGYNEWQQSSEFKIHKINDFTSARKSSIIYLVLDCSSSLGEAQIAEIRRAAISFIDKLYSTASGEKPRYVTQAASAKTAPPLTAAPSTQLKIEVSEPQINGSITTTIMQPQTVPAQPAYTLQGQNSPQYAPNFNNAEGMAQRQTQMTVDVYAPPAMPPQYVPAPRYAPPPATQTVPQYAPPATQTVPQYAPPAMPPQYVPAPQYTPPATQTVPQYAPPATQTVPQYAPPPEPVKTMLFLPAPTINLAEPYSGFWVQVGSYNDLRYAQDTWRKLFLSNCANTAIFGKELNGIMYYRVKVGPYQNRNEAQAALDVIRAANIGFNDAYIIRQ